MEKEENLQQINNEKFIQLNQQLVSEKDEIIDKIERNSNRIESEHQNNDNLDIISKEDENNDLNQQHNNKNKQEIEDLNEEQSFDNFDNINSNQNEVNNHSLSPKQNKQNQEVNNIQNKNSISKLDTLIKSNENFREIYNMINNNNSNNIINNNNNNQINSNPNLNIKNSQQNINTTVNCNQNFQKCNDKYFQDIIKSLPFKDLKLQEDNIFDLLPTKLKEKQSKQRQNSNIKGKMSNLYDEINKFAEKRYNSKSLGPYPKQTNKKIKPETKKPSHNVININTSKNFFQIPKNITIEDDSFYFPRPQKNSKQKIYNQPINKSLVSIRPSSLFTSVDKWIEHQSVPQSFYKEKEKTIENLLTSVHGYSFRSDYSNLKKNSFRPSNTKNLKLNSYNNDFYSNKLHSFTLRLHKPVNTIFENIKSKQRKTVENDKQKYNLFNVQRLNLENNVTNKDIISPFYKSRRINLFKPNTVKLVNRKLI